MISEAEFEALYTDLQPLVQSSLGKWLKMDKAIIEDLTADTFTTVWETREKYVEKGYLKAYVMRIAHNKAVSYTRTQAFKHDVTLPILLEEYTPDLEDGPEEVCELKDDVARMRTALNTLDVEQQQLINLRFFEGKDWNTIGEMFGTNASTVRVKAWRAIGKLRRQLEV